MGHRGDTDRYPENTIVSFKSALKRGCNGVELDVYYTKSGDFMIFHDTDLKRMCGRSIPIELVSKANRASYPIIAGAYAKTHKVLIPTLEEALKTLRKKGAKVFIHIKSPDLMNEKAANKLTAMINEFDMRDNSVVFTSSRKCLRLLSGRERTLGFSTKETDAAAIDNLTADAKKCGAVILHIAVRMGKRRLHIAFSADMDDLIFLQ